MRLVSIFFFLVMSISLQSQDESQLKLLDDLLKESLAEANEKYIEENTQLLEKRFPAFELSTFLGDIISLSDLQGKPTIVLVWDLYCQPCLDQMPLLNAVRKQYGSSINYISITRHSKNEVKRFLAQDKLIFRNLINAKDFIDQQLKFTALPKILLLDGEAKVKNILGAVELRVANTYNDFYENLLLSLF